MTEQNQKIVRIELQRDSEGQFLNIPAEFEFSTNEMIVKQEGSRLVIASASEVAPADFPATPTIQADIHEPSR